MADVSDISCFLSMFHRPHVELIQAARQLLSGEQAPLRQKLLADLLHTVSENIAAETRAEDPPWFEGASWIGIRGREGWEWEDTAVETRFYVSSQTRGSPNEGLPKQGACLASLLTVAGFRAA